MRNGSVSAPDRTIVSGLIFFPGPVPRADETGEPVKPREWRFIDHFEV